MTKGYRLPARYVIHTVGPVWRGGAGGESRLLDRAYESSFARARENGDIRTIAFPAISTGVYRFPREDAARIALNAMRRHESEFDGIIACLFDERSAAIYRQLLSAG